ncbi:ABC-three component system middle component 1 [Aliivibrio fischeri]|uniref:ABC-three component system middle component 1 n=1 Tax=Aliivibrio fischeri TaxID=668 RepID=UPI0012DA7961|nr:ABC-three component system middle component 1 [Aliivibrio fischeri]MUJ39041.1 hypothetical protein [Aliivibrio fischeri]
MKLLVKEVDLDFLSTEYENIEFYTLCSDDRLSFITCIVCICKNLQDVIENWRTIQNMVAVYYQHSGGFDAWNMYLAFICNEKIPIWDKYEIENNKFSARKIVLDEFQERPTIEQLIRELEKQLLGSDLKLASQSHQLEESLPNLENYYRGAPLESNSKSRDKRASMINKIIESLNNNEN